MNAISAPWRMGYIKSEKPDGCVLCLDNASCADYVLKKGVHAVAMMNLYPYTTGHIMVLPLRHIGLMESLNPEEKAEIFELVVVCVKLLKKVMKPDGFNIGMNLGLAGGAGVEDHLHVHIVPRWNGDTNFMTTVGEVRVIPEDVAKTCETLKAHLHHVGEEE